MPERSRTNRASPRQSPRRSRAGTTALAVGCISLAACYTYAPLQVDRPTPGLGLAVDLNDKGRVAMADRIGNEVARVEGTVSDVTDSTLSLRVSEVTQLSGESTRWGGETVQLR